MNPREMNSQELNHQEAGLVRSLAALAPRRASADLSLRLRVAASAEARRRRVWSNPAALAQELQWRSKLWFENLARPLAVPAAGGVGAALFLFLSIAPAFPIRRPIVDDVPVRLTTQATLESVFLIPTSVGPLEDVVLDVSVDSAGRVVHYSIAEGNEWADNPVARKSLDSTLVCTRFNPATLFGQPQAGTVRITIRRSELEVRG